MTNSIITKTTIALATSWRSAAHLLHSPTTSTRAAALPRPPANGTSTWTRRPRATPRTGPPPMVSSRASSRKPIRPTPV